MFLLISPQRGRRWQPLDFLKWHMSQDFWKEESFQNQMLEALRPSIKSYIVCAVEDILKSICLSFLQLCRCAHAYVEYFRWGTWNPPRPYF